MTEGTIRQVVRGQIAYAIDQPSSGSPGMPKRLVTGDDARDVAAYVASAVVKDNSAAANAAAAPAAAPSPPAAGSSSGSGAGDATTAAGKKVFTDAGGCVACHTLKDAGATGTVGPDLDKLAADAKTAGLAPAAYVKQSILDPDAYVAPGFAKGVMPPDFKTTLTAKQIADVVAYIVAVAGT